MWTRLGDIERIFNSIDMLQNRMNRMHAEFGRGRIPSVWGARESGPSANLYDCGDHLEMRVEVPGIAKENLSIKIQGNYLEIGGSRKANVPEGYTAHRRERGSTEFTRSFTLPVEINADRVEARLANGILHLVLPKTETAKPRQISIQ